MKLLKLIKQHKTERKFKSYNELIIIESRTYYWIIISLLHKHPVIEYEIEIFEWKLSNGIKLFNTLAASYEYCRNSTDNLPLPVQTQLSEKLITFSWFFIAFFQSALNFAHLEKKISLIAQVFLNLLTPKDVFP